MSLSLAILFLSSFITCSYGQVPTISQSFTLSNGNQNFGGEFQSSKVIFKDTPNCTACLVTVEGLLRLPANPTPNYYGFLMGILPENARPVESLIFNTNSNIGSTRIDVLPNGEIRACAASSCDITSISWISLNRISYYVGSDTNLQQFFTAVNLPLSNNNQPWSSVFEDPRVIYQDTSTYPCTVCLVTLQGLVRLGTVTNSDTGFLIGVIPHNIQLPSKSISFLTISNKGSIQLDINSNGEIRICRFKSCNGVLTNGDWVSLSGISFFVGTSTNILALKPVPLLNNNVIFGGEWKEPLIIYEDTTNCIVCVVSLEGLLFIRSTAIVAQGYLIGQLPENARPPATLIFNIQTSVGSIRLDILPNGELRTCRASGCANTLNSPAWVSLNGISYYVGNNK